MLQIRSKVFATCRLGVFLSLAMVLGVLAGCAHANPASSASGETETRALSSGDAAIHIAYVRDGNYSLSFTEANFVPASNPQAASSASADPQATSSRTSSASNDAGQDAGGAGAEAFADLTAADIEVTYDLAAGSTLDDGQESGSSDGRSREAIVDSFQNSGKDITITFRDPDAASNVTDSYTITIGSLGATVPLVVDFEDHTLTAEPAELSASSSDPSITLSLAQGSFAADISPESISLDHAFSGMSVNSADADGGYLNLTLSGSPALDPDEPDAAHAGVITVAPTGFVNGAHAQKASVNVVPDNADKSTASSASTAASASAADASSASAAASSADSSSSSAAASAADSSSSEAMSTALTTSQSADPAATEVMLHLESPVNLASTIDASQVSLDGSFAGHELNSVARVSDTELDVCVAGPFDNGSEGKIELDASSFAEGSATGTAIVEVAHEDASIQEEANSRVNDAFVLTVDLGTAQLPGSFAEDSVSLPAGDAITVSDVQYEAYGSTIAISVNAPGDTEWNQFKALDDALTHGGVRFAGTTIGDVLASASIDESLGQTSALSYATPELTAFIMRGADGKGFVRNDDGSADIRLIVYAVSTGGDPDLANAQITFDDSTLTPTDKIVDQNSAYQAELTMETLTKQQIDELKSELGIEDEEQLLDSHAYQIASRMSVGLSVAGGIENEWGIELPASEPVHAVGYNLAGLTVDASDDDETAEDANGSNGSANDDAEAASEDDAPFDVEKLELVVLAANERTAESAAKSSSDNKDEEGKKAKDEEEKSLKRTNEALKYSSETLKIIGDFTSAFAAGNPGNFITGLSNIVGLIAGSTAPTGWTVDDVMNQVLALDGRMDAMSAQLGDIAHQLNKIDASLDYKTQVGNLSTLSKQALAYRPWVKRMLQSTMKASDRDTYKLSSNPGNSKTGKALQNFYKQTKRQSSLTAGNKSTYQVALELADAIVGDSSLQQTGGARSFFNYTAQCVNWEPEAYYARKTFSSYVSGAFICAYMSAVNELNYQIVASHDEVEKDVYRQNLRNLAQKANEVADLLGTNGSLAASTQDRSDGKVLCTVNNKLYEKYNGQDSDHPALNFPFHDPETPEFKNVFSDLLHSRDEDTEHAYSNKSAMSRADFDTMASRQAYIRTIPGFSDVTSIYDEFGVVGLCSPSLSMRPPRSFTTPYRTSVSFDDADPLSRALVGDFTQTGKSDASSIYHKRWYSADLYDLKNNKPLGKQQVYYYNVDYQPMELYWLVDLQVSDVVEVIAS